jgi:hypothetical protein
MATTWRGQDGEVQLGGTPATTIGGVFGWTVVSDFAALEATVMGEVWRTYRPGLPGWNGTMRARFNNEDGQDQLLATVTGLNPAGSLGEVRFVINDQNDAAPGTRYLHGEVIITGVNLVAELTNIIEASYTFQGSGPLELTWPTTP